MRIQLDITLPSISRHAWRLLTALIVTAMLLAFPLLALASHQFGDVPNANPFHGDISAIANAGVTSGCGGGNYCPDRNVTRAEMAAFMNRLGALSSNKTPVVNADKVDGFQGNDLALGTATIPSGMTVTGFRIWEGPAVANNALIQFTVDLPAQAPSAPSDVNFASSVYAIDDDLTCTGTSSAPTAPAGKVCIYIYGVLNIDTASGSVGVAAFADRAFAVAFLTNTASVGADTYLYFSWAYRAP